MPFRSRRRELYEPTQSGTITKLSPQKKNTNRCNVHLDGDFAFGLQLDTVLEFGLSTGDELSVERQRDILRADRGRLAFVAAIDYLSYKARTEREVRRKLSRKGYESDQIEGAIERLYELDYLDDRAYARSYVQSRFRSKGYGPRRIARELKQRGVAAAVVETVVEDEMEADETIERAREKARKKWRLLSGEEDPRRKRKKLQDHLLRRGYGYDTIRRLVDELETDHA